MKKPKLLTLIIWLVSAIAGAILSWCRGQDLNWDLRNYHFYNAWALLNDRWGHDLEVAHSHTFYNPLLDLPFYLLSQLFSPLTTGLMLGALHGLNLAMLWMIFRKVCPKGTLSKIGVFILSVCSAILVFRSPSMWCEMGGVFHDNVVSLFMLSGLWVLLGVTPPEPGSPHKCAVMFWWAGFLAGLGTGAKYTAAIYGVGLGVVACMVAVGHRKNVMRNMMGFGVGALVGFVLVAGPWMLRLWHEFQNPTFPMFNDVFKSEWAPFWSFTDPRWRPTTWLAALRFPLDFLSEGLSVASAESPFRTPVPFLLLALSLAVGIILLIRFMRSVLNRKAGKEARKSMLSQRVTLVLVFAGVSYLLWVFRFGYYRYLVALEVLSPILVFILLRILVRRAQLAGWLACVTCLVAVFFIKPLERTRVEWRDNWFPIPYQKSISADAMVLLPEDFSAVGHVPSAFPDRVRFVRIKGHLAWPGWTTKWQQHVEKAVRDHTGPFFALATAPVDPNGFDSTLECYGLESSGSERIFLRPDRDWPCLFAVQRMEQVELVGPIPGRVPAWASLPRHVIPENQAMHINESEVRPFALGSQLFYVIPHPGEVQPSVGNSFVQYKKFPINWIDWDEPVYVFPERSDAHQLGPALLYPSPFQKFKEPMTVSMPMRLGPDCGELIVVKYFFKRDPHPAVTKSSDRRRTVFKMEGEGYEVAMEKNLLYMPCFPKRLDRTASFYPIEIIPPSHGALQFKTIELSPLSRVIKLDPPLVGPSGWKVSGQIVIVPESPAGGNWNMRTGHSELVAAGQAGPVPTRAENNFKIEVRRKSPDELIELRLDENAFWLKTIEVLPWDGESADSQRPEMVENMGF